MKIKKIYLPFIFFVVVALVTLSTYLFFFKSPSEKILVANNDPSYTVTFTETPRLTQYLEDWEIFNREYKLADDRTILINQILFTLTPEKQTMYQIAYDPHKPPIETFSIQTHDNGTLEYIVQLDKAYHDSISQRELDYFVTILFMQALYYSAHAEAISELTPSTEMYESFSVFQKEEALPFSVTKNSNSSL